MHPIINKRKSILCFDERPVSMKILEELFEAARWAPSAYNEQPWRFIVGVKGTKSYENIFNSLAENNQIWAKIAPVLIVSVALSVFKHNSKQNKHGWHDTAMSYANLVFQANSIDLYVHPMAGFSSEKITDIFSIPANFDPVIVAALGYKGNCNNMPEEIKKRESRKQERMEISDFVFTEKWGNAFTC